MEPMKVLVACEFSGIVRDAFIAKGHDAISADLLPTERPGPHHQGDVTPLLAEPWDLVIAHPPCRYLANSGVRWMHEDVDRWDELKEATEFFLKCYDANAPRVAVENPVMHGHARVRIRDMHPTFCVQPWQFGHGETKQTCFWSRGLWPLRATNVVSGRAQRVFRAPDVKDRWKERSRTYPGMAEAMADQWGRPDQQVDMFGVQP